MQRLEKKMNIVNLTNGNMQICGYEWKPIHDFIMIEIVDNEFKFEKTESGLYMPDSGGVRNESAGQVGEVELRIVLAKVIEVGAGCSFLQPGDYVYVDRLSSRPIPLAESNDRQMPERNILVMGRPIN